MAKPDTPNLHAHDLLNAVEALNKLIAEKWEKERVRAVVLVKVGGKPTPIQTDKLEGPLLEVVQVDERPDYRRLWSRKNGGGDES